MELIKAGKIVNTHGIRGEVKIDVWMNAPGELCALSQAYYADGSALVFERARVHKNQAIVKISGVDDIEGAEALRGREIYIEKTPESLAEGEYYIEDILGLEVLDADTGARYGRITDVYTGVANDAYEIELTGTGRRVLFPVIKDVIIETDIGNGTLKIRPLQGMFEI